MKPIIICTEKRGVFFGYADDEAKKTLPKQITLTDAQNCIYWSADVKGVLGLAAGGPTAGCRVGPRVPRLTLYNVTADIMCTKEAEAAWISQPWS